MHNLDEATGKTKVVIDNDLLKGTGGNIGARSKKEAIEARLRALARPRHREVQRKEVGIFDLDLTLDELERLRHAD